jgi:hypothetical protein
MQEGAAVEARHEPGKDCLLRRCFDRQSTAYRHAANGGVWYTGGGYRGENKNTGWAGATSRVVTGAPRR